MAFFVGGTTQTYEFDFFTKVANSTIECPMKIYEQNVVLGSLPNPSTGWVENTTQSDLDTLKAQDGVVFTKSVTTNGMTKAIMIEVDLTTICNNVYGNSNINMKSNFQTNSNIDIYAIASGANAGATAYKYQSYAWNTSTNQWDFLGENTNSTIQLINRVLNSSNYINSSNKVYLMLVSGYASDGTIASSISLDYIKFKINFNRIADTITPITTTFASRWAIILKDLFFMNTANPKPLKIGSVNIDLSAFISSKKMHNIIIYQDGTNIKYYALASGGNLQSGTIMTEQITGTQNIIFNSNDYFTNSMHIINNLNPVNNNEAEAILRGQKAGFENAELLYSNDFSDVNKWTLSNNASISNNKLTLTDWNSKAEQNVWVFPNNQYEIQLQKKDQMGVVEVLEYYSKNSNLSTDTGDIFIRSTILGAGLTKFTTSNYTNKIKVRLKNQLEGFSRNSVAYMSNGTQVTNNVPRLEVVSGNDKAILIEEGTINGLSYVYQSNSNLLNYFFCIKSGVIIEIDDTQTPPINGAKVVKHYTPFDDAYIEAKDSSGISCFMSSTSKMPVSSKSSITFSIWAKGKNGGEEIEMFIFNYNSDNGTFYISKSQTFTLTNTWNRYSITATMPYNAVRAWARVDNNLANQTVYWCAPQLEQKPYPTSFVNGTRNDETLFIPKNINNYSSFTIEFRLKKLPYNHYSNNENYLMYGGEQGYIYWSNNNANNHYIKFNSSGVDNTVLYGLLNNITTSFHTLAFVFDKINNKKILYYDGIKINEVSIPTNEFFDWNKVTGLYRSISLISDFHISNIAYDDTTIQARSNLAAAGNGFPITANTVYYLDFNQLAGAEFSNISLKEKF